MEEHAREALESVHRIFKTCVPCIIEHNRIHFDLSMSSLRIVYIITALSTNTIYA